MTRVIAGQARGRRLQVPAGRTTRPTGDRVREAMFAAAGSILGSFEGMRVLDLYAGSGAAGLEALSRGASHALLVESGPRSAQVIRANIGAVGLDGGQLVHDRVERLLGRGLPAGVQPYDVAFADPPYALPGEDMTEVLAALATRGWLAPGALVIVERASRSEPLRWPDGFSPVRSRRYGEAMLWYATFDAAPASTDARSLLDKRERLISVRRVVCPGSFDPVTNGHLDIISRAAGLYDEVVVAVLINMTKKSLFTVDERIEMLRTVTAEFGNVRVDRFHGLLVDFCEANGISAVVKGLRAVSDFDYEMQMAQMNYRMAKVETLFMTTNPLYSFLSSSLIREVAKYGGDVSGLVPEPVIGQLRARLAES